MASTKNNFMLFLYIALLSFIPSQTHVFATSRATISINANSDFHQVCQRTTHSDACISIISQDPRGNLKTDPIGFSTILNAKAVAVADNLIGTINDLFGGSITAPVRDLLQDANALIVYADSIIDRLAFSSLNHQTYPQFKSNLEQAKANVTQSAPILGKLPPNFSSLTDQNNLLEIAIQTTLEIVNINECDKIEACTA